MAAKAKRSSAERPSPEKKYGPFHDGVCVAVWLNLVESDDGLRYFRSVTIDPRRFRDTKTGEWKDAGSFRAPDLPALILGLQSAHEFISCAALPGEPAEELFQENTPPSEVERLSSRANVRLRIAPCTRVRGAFAKQQEIGRKL